MPRSKRDRVVALTQTGKKGKEAKAKLIDEVREQAEAHKFLWVFEVEHMRNNLLQEVRTAWKGSRIFLGRNAVMRKGLGATPEDECRLGVHKVANMLEGSRGLLFTDETPDVVTEWFESFKKRDFARTGNKATETFELPAGPILINDEPAPHSLEPQFRKLGLSTSLLKGVPTLNAPHTVCSEGDTLNPNQVNLLKLFGKTFATFQIVPLLGISLADGAICGGTVEGEMADEE
ncbi:ribosomal protein L10-domain-containing protein [Rhodotorula diobovata]|uniref:Ribosome assembly factor mrt4 n=1 Tax=Rhodotorula diobovata TaxID=5288 RepID=A0A5C5G6I4_9BASI|nr:ribosomal protein L10-domain-containing protein [Rhodotorula diobovata]